MENMLPPYVFQFLSLAASSLIFVLGAAMLFVAAIFIYDINQKTKKIVLSVQGQRTGETQKGRPHVTGCPFFVRYSILSSKKRCNEACNGVPLVQYQVQIMIYLTIRNYCNITTNTFLLKIRLRKSGLRCDRPFFMTRKHRLFDQAPALTC